MRTAAAVLARAGSGLLACLLSVAVLAQDEGAPSSPLLFHVHGVAFARDGRSLVVPGHSGLVEFKAGRWSPAKGPAHDFAGFAVSGPAYYASGHPAQGSELPDPMGLVKSVDGGASWRTLSAGGEADFHLIAAGWASGAVFVLNATQGRTLVETGLHSTTDDGRTWRRAAAEGLRGRLLGLAAHPKDSRTVAAATDQGLYLSSDSGATFRRIDPAAATAVGFDVGGDRLLYTRAVRRTLVALQLSTGEQRAIQLPSLGLDYVTHLAVSPVDGEGIAIATDRRHMYLSPDSGRTWRRIARDGDLP